MTTKHILTVLGCFLVINLLYAVLVFAQSNTPVAEESEPSFDMESVNYQVMRIHRDKEDLVSTLNELKGFRKTVQDSKVIAEIDKTEKEIDDAVKIIDQKCKTADSFLKFFETTVKNIKDKTAELKKIEDEADALTAEVIKKADQIMKSSEKKLETSPTVHKSKPTAAIEEGNTPQLSNKDLLTQKLLELDQYMKTVQDKNVQVAIQNVKKDITEVSKKIDQKFQDAQKKSKEIEASKKSIADKMSELEKIRQETSSLASGMTEKANELMKSPEEKPKVVVPQKPIKPIHVPAVAISEQQKNEVRKSVNQLAWKLFSKSGNTPICPYSAAVVLNMLREGSDGETAAEMEKFLGTKLHGNMYFAGMKVVENAKFPSMNVCSMVMFGNDCKPVPQYISFINESKGLINDDVVIGTADFASNPLKEMEDMNKWFAETTNGEIKKVFTKISPMTRVVLANVTLLDAKWRKYFHKGEKQDFLLKNGQKKKVTMMTATSRVMYGKEKDYEILVLPYQNDMGMVIILPKDIKFLEQIQTQKDVNWFMDSVKKTNWKMGKVTMPPFKTVGNTDLIPLFCQIGLKNTFSPEANFSNIFGHDSFMVDQFLQSVVVEVNETGTKATAATVATIGFRGTIQPDFNININRPFIYAIVDNLESLENSMILFIGVMDGSDLEVEHE